MSLFHRLMESQRGSYDPPYSTPEPNGSTKLISIVREANRIPEDEPFTTVMAAVPLAAANNDGYLNLSLQTQAFGPVPTGLGISEQGDIIRVQTEALEGDIDCGTYL